VSKLDIAKRFFLTVAAVALSASFGTVMQPLRAQADSGVQVIEVTAKKYEYNPSIIKVKKGTKVELKIHALDRVHGFKISQFRDDSDGKGEPGLIFTSNYSPDGWKIEKDNDTVIDFTANQPGTYTFKCSLFCGFGHMHMKGQLIVEP
jgi:cytochrome c oxidase subunit 2